MPLYLLVLLLLLTACSTEKSINTTSYDAWIHRSEWKANSFAYNWQANSTNRFSNKMPIFYKTVAGKKDYHIAIELADLDSTIGDFDSLSITYRSSLPLGVTIALLPEDAHGFELTQDARRLLPASPKKKRTVTLRPSHFGEDWNKQKQISISRCNNIAISNLTYLTPGQEVYVTIEDVRLYKKP